MDVMGTSTRRYTECCYNNHSPLDWIKNDLSFAKLKPADLEYGPQVGECMEGTRRDILTKVEQWITDFGGPNILWLKGHPGVGKSAIATSVVERLRAVGRLGSSFFFQRQKATSMTPNALWLTVAYNLARQYPTIGKNIMAALNADETIPTTVNVIKLFRQLVQEPLMASEEIPASRSPIVVIDALDECGGLDGPGSKHRTSLVRTLESWSRLPRQFKLIVTSRGERDFEHLFSTTAHCLIEILTGQTVEAQSSQDIHAFLTYQLQQTVLRHPRSLPPDWPGTRVVSQMTLSAAGLFIWAETIVKFINGGPPERRLRMVLEGVGTSGMGTLYGLYEQILDASFGNQTADEIRDACTIMGTILFAKAPLSSSAIAHLLSIPHSTVENMCNGLRSVLDSGSILQFHHQSFVDFLLDPGRRTSKFIIKYEEATRNLTLVCLRVMRDDLKFNICDLKSSYVRNIDVPNIASRVERCIPPHLSYSCQFWASHLAETTFDVEVLEGLQYFMNHQFLFWLEVLSLTNKVNHASGMLLLMVDWIPVSIQ